MNALQRDKLCSWWQGKILWDVSMADYSTLRAGGRADCLIDVLCLEELTALIKWLTAEDVPHYVVGRGSNLLVTEQGYSGVVIRLMGNMTAITPLSTSKAGEQVVRAGAGSSMAALVSWCSGRGLSGLEFMTGIPGSVGGAVWMNAGAWGYAIGDRLKKIVLVDAAGCCRDIASSRLELSYRKLGWQDGRLDNAIIVSADFLLFEDDKSQISCRCREYLEQRRGKQPKGVASAGSFFKNPPDDSAGRLIDLAGLKGASEGGAMVSPVHANFIVNTGGATAVDIIRLMELIQKKVYSRFGIHLEPEVKIVQG